MELIYGSNSVIGSADGRQRCYVSFHFLWKLRQRSLGKICAREILSLYTKMSKYRLAMRHKKVENCSTLVAAVVIASRMLGSSPVAVNIRLSLPFISYLHIVYTSSRLV